MVKNLTLIEWKDAWRWGIRNFFVEIGEQVAYLYNEEGKLLTATLYTCRFDELDMVDFTIKSIQTLTKQPKEMIATLYKKRHKTKEELWNIYRIPIQDEKFQKMRRRWIQIKSEVEFLASTKPNYLGFYYAEIKAPLQKDQLKFLNDNITELLVDFFFVLECFIGKEEIPYTYSQAWFENYKQYGNRKYPDATARYNVEQTYYNYILDRIQDTFPTKDKTCFLHIHQLFSKLAGENKYYTMDALLNDSHFFIDENEYVIFTPVIGGELDVM